MKLGNGSGKGSGGWEFRSEHLDGWSNGSGAPPGNGWGWGDGYGGGVPDAFGEKEGHGAGEGDGMGDNLRGDGWGAGHDWWEEEEIVDEQMRRFDIRHGLNLE